MDNYKVLCGQSVVYSSSNHALATKKCLQLAKNDPSNDYSLIKESTLMTPVSTRESLQGEDIQQVLATTLPNLISRHALDPKFLPVLKNLQKATAKGNVKKIQQLLTKYQGPKRGMRSIQYPKLVQALINKSEKITKNGILQNGDDLEFMSWSFTDVIEFITIAQALSQGHDKKVYRMIHSLDTGARDELPSTVWNKFDH